MEATSKYGVRSLLPKLNPSRDCILIFDYEFIGSQPQEPLVDGAQPPANCRWNHGYVGFVIEVGGFDLEFGVVAGIENRDEFLDV